MAESGLRAGRASVASRDGTLCVFDTAIATDNLGDHIIMDAVWETLREVFGAGALTERIATHCYMPPQAYPRLLRAPIGIVGGTTLLRSHMLAGGRWRLRPYDFLFLRNLVLLGVGWQRNERAVDLPSKLLLNRILSRTHLHSVRDEYTLSKLQGQVRHLAYTACPTLWSLTPERCARLPRARAPGAVVSLTYYRPDAADRELIRLLHREYARVWYWCQQPQDAAYFESLGLCEPAAMIRDIESYNHLLISQPVDVIGTRLHGAIRALQLGRRALILAVDDRAIELARSTALPVIERRDLQATRAWTAASPAISITLPWDAIGAWKKQFRRD